MTGGIIFWRAATKAAAALRVVVFFVVAPFADAVLFVDTLLTGAFLAGAVAADGCSVTGDATSTEMADFAAFGGVETGLLAEVAPETGLRSVGAFTAGAAALAPLFAGVERLVAALVDVAGLVLVDNVFAVLVVLALFGAGAALRGVFCCAFAAVLALAVVAFETAALAVAAFETLVVLVEATFSFEAFAAAFAGVLGLGAELTLAADFAAADLDLAWVAGLATRDLTA